MRRDITKMTLSNCKFDQTSLTIRRENRMNKSEIIFVYIAYFHRGTPKSTPGVCTLWSSNARINQYQWQCANYVGETRSHRLILKLDISLARYIRRRVIEREEKSTILVSRYKLPINQRLAVTCMQNALLARKLGLLIDR